MKHPFSVAMIAMLSLFGMALIALFAFRVFNGAVIPQDWRDNDSNTSDNDGKNNVPDVPRKTVSASGNIIVTSPVADAIIGLPLVITGSARVFENALNYRVLDEDGAVLTEGVSMSNAPDVGEFGSFTVTTSYPVPSGATGTVEVFDYSAKDGAVIDLAIVPIVFPTMASMMVKVYWSNAGAETDCDSVVAAERRIPKTVATGYAALTELLDGPNTKEIQNNSTTSIPSGVSIKSLTIADGVAKVEFSSNLETGGSCRVSLIRSQIEATLKQFPTVTSVVISTAGNNPEESLQP